MAAALALGPHLLLVQLAAWVFAHWPRLAGPECCSEPLQDVSTRTIVSEYLLGAVDGNLGGLLVAGERRGPDLDSFSLNPAFQLPAPGSHLLLREPVCPSLASALAAVGAPDAPLLPPVVVAAPPATLYTPALMQHQRLTHKNSSAAVVLSENGLHASSASGWRTARAAWGSDAGACYFEVASSLCAKSSAHQLPSGCGAERAWQRSHRLEHSPRQCGGQRGL